MNFLRTFSQKVGSIVSQKTLLVFFIGCLLPTGLVFALDVVDRDIPTQEATQGGSSNSRVWFSTGAASSGTTSYMNKNNDSDTIGNYLRGYYYDTQFGFFRLDWNMQDTTQNVWIVSSTDACGTGYGYKLGGYAYSTVGGLIQFNYNSATFVYYCESDKKLHGWAYSKHTGFQNFEGISFEIIALSQNTPPPFSSESDPFFVNNNSMILMNLPIKSNSMDIQGKGLARKEGHEVIFYIIK